MYNKKETSIASEDAAKVDTNVTHLSSFGSPTVQPKVWFHSKGF